MEKNKVDMARLEMLIRGAEPEGIDEIVFVRCYAGSIMNERLIEIATDLASKIDINDLTTHEWQYLFLGLVMGDKDYRDSIELKKQGPIH